MLGTTKGGTRVLESTFPEPVFRAGNAALSRAAQWRAFIATLIVVDLLLAGAAFRLAYFVRFNLGVPIFQLDVIPVFDLYQAFALGLAPLWTVIFAANGLYQREHLLGGTQEYARLFRASSIGMALVVLAGFLEPDLVFARGWLLLAWIFTFFLTALARFALRRAVYQLRTRGYFLSPTLVIGINAETRSLVRQLVSWRTSGLDVLGCIDDRVPAGTAVEGGLYSLGGIDRLDDLIERYQVEELILATSALSRDQIVQVFSHYGLLDNVNVRLSSGLFEIITTSVEVRELAYTPLVTINKVRMTGIDRTLKLVLDYVITIPGLLFITPLLLLIGLLIRLDSPGPVIYRRRVMGLNGKAFDAYKFRTMYTNGDEILARYPELQEELARTHKLKNDPRITNVGRLLRKTSLDELPQLFNVLRREMSLVGPRMIAPEEMEMYQQWGLNLLTVPPGITGLWQVSGRSEISYRERVELDMNYIRNWTIWSDLQVLLQTIPAVLKGRGAY
ncbi:MAG: sugar transferase [Candidatus Promineifilaceae bacterium]|nr:sugar transferase [Candidatus Promineifilaceae bacterium]